MMPMIPQLSKDDQGADTSLVFYHKNRSKRNGRRLTSSIVQYSVRVNGVETKNQRAVSVELPYHVMKYQNV